MPLYEIQVWANGDRTTTNGLRSQTIEISEVLGTVPYFDTAGSTPSATVCGLVVSPEVQARIGYVPYALIADVNALVPAVNVADPNTVYAGPASGSDPDDAEFRALVAADLPTVPVSKGGLNQTSAFVAGGVLWGSSTTVGACTVAGSAGQILTSGGTSTPAWVTLLPIANGGTNSAATATAGGVGYGTGTAHAYTAAGSAGQILTSGGASAPAWVTLLPVANGGTNSSATPTNGGVGYGTGTAHAYSSAGTSGQILQSAGAASPTWTSAPVLAGGATLGTGGTAITRVLLATGIVPFDNSTIAVTVTGVTAASKIQATIVSANGTAVSIISAIPSSNTVTITLSGVTDGATSVDIVAFN